MVRQPPIIFGQTDYLQQLGTTGGSIHDFGCYLTSFATLAKLCGKDTDPIRLNTMLILRELYVNGNLMPDDALTKIFPDLIFQRTIEFPNANPATNTPAVPADINMLRELYKDPNTWVIAKISLPHAPFTHFALVTGVNGTVTIADPMTKQNEDFAQRYGDPVQNIIKFVIYKGTPARVTDDDSIRNERDLNWSVAADIVAHLGVPVTPEDKQGMGQKAKDKIDSYNALIAGWKSQAEEWQKKYDAERKLTLDTKAENARLNEQDVDYGTEALEAQKKASELKDGVQKMAQTLELQYDPVDDRKIVEKILDEIKHLKFFEQKPAETHIDEADAISSPITTRQNSTDKNILKSILGIFFQIS